MNKAVRKILQDHKLKVTAQRLVILHVLMSSEMPLSAEAIYTKVRSQGINLVTVYRTVHILHYANILKRVDLHTGSVLYEFFNEHHHHIVCTQCGLIEDFDDCGVERLTAHVLTASAAFSDIQEHSLELFGICTQCASSPS